ncbi:MAG: AI-2E family transporter [Candidatus Pacebacteria bacterium]|nr:AI-2E family transporter [Candidatus Paceibacterota bacterium]MBP9840028.1 AI-2E family transporter [Candidatus Paceibacterota bacterium]
MPLMDRMVNVSITPGTIIRALFIGVAAYVAWLLKDLLLLILTAIVIASAIEPGVIFFIRRGIARVFSVLLMYVLVFGSVFSVVYFFFPPIIDEAQAFIASVPGYLDDLSIPESLSVLAPTTEGGEAQSLFSTLVSLRGVFSAGTEGVIALIAAFFGSIFALFLVVILSFYFALQETGVDDFLRLITPVKHENYVVDLWQRAKRKIGLWMQGQLLLSVIMGVLTTLGLLIMGVPHALLLGIITGMAELIPIFGGLVAGLLAVAIAFSAEGLALAVIVAGLYIILNQFESNLIYPLVVKKVVGLPPLLVILALVAGAELAGFLGILLSVPIAASLQEFFADIEKGKRKAAELSNSI